MKWTEAIEIFIDRINPNKLENGGDRIRELCSDKNINIVQRDGYRRKIVQFIGETLELPEVQQSKIQQNVAIARQDGSILVIPIKLSMQINDEIYKCPQYTKDSGCGCGLSRCNLGKGKIDTVKNDGTGLVSWIECAKCLRPSDEIIARL